MEITNFQKSSITDLLQSSPDLFFEIPDELLCDKEFVSACKQAVVLGMEERMQKLQRKFLQTHPEDMENATARFAAKKNIRLMRRINKKIEQVNFEQRLKKYDTMLRHEKTQLPTVEDYKKIVSDFVK